MNNILSYSPEFDLLELEPGVTFQQLYVFLALNGNEHIVSGYGGSSQASIVGNALDRGVGKGYFGNRELSSDITEVVLGDGTIVDLTERLSATDKTAKFPSSVTGIDLKKIFFQSNLGIVTKMVIQLERIPPILCNISFSTESDEKFFILVEKLRILNAEKLISPVYSLYNDERLVVGSGLYQKKDFDKQKNMSEITNEVIKKVEKRYERKLSRWNCSLAIHCSTEEEALSKETKIHEILKDCINSFYFTSIKKDKAKEIIINSLAKDEKQIKESEYKFLFNLGYTNEHDQKTMYWRLEKEVILKNAPIKDGCGLIFFVPKIPFCSEDINRAFNLVKRVSEKYQYELPITFQFKSKQLVYMILPILFDRNSKESIRIAHQYHQELDQLFAENNYVPYRLNNINMNKYFSKKLKYGDLVLKIKRALDPNNIIDPLKYMNDSNNE